LLKEERLARRFLNAADELPAHERMQLRILVDRFVDRQQQSLRAERLEMCMQVGIAARGVGHFGFRSGKRVR
jgi:hypothetical protein